MVEEETRSKIGDTNRIGDIYRYISEMPKSKKSKEVTERNEVWEECDRNKGGNLIDGCDMDDNHGSGGKT